MAKKDRKVEKPGKGERWTVRGVSADLQRAAGDAARARGMTLGQWLSEVVSEATRRSAQSSEELASSWERSIEERLARLEQARGPSPLDDESLDESASAAA